MDRTFFGYNVPGTRYTSERQKRTSAQRLVSCVTKKTSALVGTIYRHLVHIYQVLSSSYTKRFLAYAKTSVIPKKRQQLVRFPQTREGGSVQGMIYSIRPTRGKASLPHLKVPHNRREQSGENQHD